MTDSVESSVTTVARISSHITKASSTFCERVNASAFRAYIHEMTSHSHKNISARTLTRLLLGYFFSTLLHALMADLFDPWSSASKTGQF